MLIISTPPQPTKPLLSYPMNKTLSAICTAVLLTAFFACTQPPHDSEAKRRADSLAIAHKADSLAKLMLQQKADSIAQALSLAESRPKHHDYGPCPVSVKACS